MQKKKFQMDPTQFWQLPSHSLSAKRINTNPCWLEMLVICARHMFVCLLSSLPLEHHPSPSPCDPSGLANQDALPQWLATLFYPSASYRFRDDHVTQAEPIKIFPDIWYMNIGRQSPLLPFQLEVIKVQTWGCWQSFFWSVLQNKSIQDKEDVPVISNMSLDLTLLKDF